MRRHRCETHVSHVLAVVLLHSDKPHSAIGLHNEGWWRNVSYMIFPKTLPHGVLMRENRKLYIC